MEMLEETVMAMAVEVEEEMQEGEESQVVFRPIASQINWANVLMDRSLLYPQRPLTVFSKRGFNLWNRLF
jgi:hypothetical protein